MSVSLAELFARDPREQTDEEFKEIIRQLREARPKFLLGDQTAGKLTGTQEALTRLDLDVKL